MNWFGHTACLLNHDFSTILFHNFSYFFKNNILNCFILFMHTESPCNTIISKIGIFSVFLLYEQWCCKPHSQINLVWKSPFIRIARYCQVGVYGIFEWQVTSKRYPVTTVRQDLCRFSTLCVQAVPSASWLYLKQKQ